MKLASISESSLSRIQSKIATGIIAGITAYRSEFTKHQNQQRTTSLVAKLRHAGYSVTAVQGSYIENHGSDDAVEVSEHSFVVAPRDEKTAASLERDVLALGEHFDQDSVLIVKDGKGVLVGTSRRENAWPALGHSEPVGGMNGGKAAQFMSRVNGRPYTFEGLQSMDKPGTINGIRTLAILASKPWQEIELPAEIVEKVVDNDGK